MANDKQTWFVSSTRTAPSLACHSSQIARTVKFCSFTVGLAATNSRHTKCGTSSELPYTPIKSFTLLSITISKNSVPTVTLASMLERFILNNVVCPHASRALSSSDECDLLSPTGCGSSCRNQVQQLKLTLDEGIISYFGGFIWLGIATNKKTQNLPTPVVKTAERYIHGSPTIMHQD